MRGQRREGEADGQRHDRKSEDAAARRPQLPEVEGEAAFEHDDGDSQADDRPQAGAESGRRLKDLQPRSDDQPDGEEEHDRRQAQPPRQPLRADASDGDAQNGDGDSVGHENRSDELTKVTSFSIAILYRRMARLVHAPRQRRERARLRRQSAERCHGDGEMIKPPTAMAIERAEVLYERSYSAVAS